MKRTVRYTVLVLIAIINSLVITTSLYAVLPYNELHQLNMSNGLVDNIITCIYQDQDRFMWFGSSNGLSRYDGKQILIDGKRNLFFRLFRMEKRPFL